MLESSTLANAGHLADSRLVFTGSSASASGVGRGPIGDLHWPLDGIDDRRAQALETEFGRGLRLISNTSRTDG